MTPKEKANELVDRFDEKQLELEQGTCTDYDIQCALICVKEILNDNFNIYDSDRLNHKYWKEVKTEIEKL